MIAIFIFLKFRNSYFQGIQNQIIVPSKATRFFLIEDNFRKMASIKYVDMRKIVNFGRRKCYLEKKANFFLSLRQKKDYFSIPLTVKRLM